MNNSNSLFDSNHSSVDFPNLDITNSTGTSLVSDNFLVVESTNVDNIQSTSFLDNLPLDSDILTNMPVDEFHVFMPRKSTRSRLKPAWWDDYVIPGQNSTYSTNASSTSMVSKYQ